MNHQQLGDILNFPVHQDPSERLTNLLRPQDHSKLQFHLFRTFDAAGRSPSVVSDVNVPKNSVFISFIVTLFNLEKISHIR